MLTPDLADALEDGHGGAEVAYVEHWQLEIHVAEVTHAVGQRLTACVTVIVLGAGALWTGSRVTACDSRIWHQRHT